MSLQAVQPRAPATLIIKPDPLNFSRLAAPYGDQSFQILDASQHASQVPNNVAAILPSSIICATHCFIHL